jgi:hypothetical protein
MNKDKEQLIERLRLERDSFEQTLTRLSDE